MDFTTKKASTSQVKEWVLETSEATVRAGSVGEGVGRGVVEVGDPGPVAGGGRNPRMGGRMAGFIPLHLPSQSKFKHCPVIALSH